MTLLPVQKFELRSRGVIREGIAADRVVFDENKAKMFTFKKPHTYIFRFLFVYVNRMRAAL